MSVCLCYCFQACKQVRLKKPFQDSTFEFSGISSLLLLASGTDKSHTAGYETHSQIGAARQAASP